MGSNRNKISHASEEENVLDLYSMITDVGKHWLSILLLTISAMLLAYVALSIINPPNYATTATMVVKNVDEGITVNSSSGSDVYENLNYAADSASRLKNILNSKGLKNAVAKELGISAFEGSASATTLGESNLLQIVVRAKSPYISYKEAESILRNYTKFSGDLVGGTELKVLEHPQVQEKPEHPLANIKYAFVAGNIVFILVFMCLAFLSLNRDTVHNSKEVEIKIDTKLLATIMHENKYRKGKKRIGGEKASILITDPVTSFQYAESMRKLATRLINEMTENNYKTLLVSSATENEGKSTVAVNIALAMAQIDKKVLLVDMDFRKPSMYKILNMQEARFNELSTFLENSAKKSTKEIREKCADLICKVPGTDLSVVLNRKSIPQAMERNADLIRTIIEKLREEADYIVIDTAPISLVSDAEELAYMVDTSVLVVRQHMVEAKEINDTIDALGGRDRVIGCVFNNARSPMSKSSSVYGYGYGGHYAG